MKWAGTMAKRQDLSVVATASAEPGVSAMLPMAEAKLAGPPLRPDLIDRPRIREALDAGHAAALTLVAAPAGYGKTTAVRAWCEGRDSALAWARLDAGDNDPIRLWTCVATAVDRIRPGLARPALRRLATIGGSIEAAVDELANGLASFGGELDLVLDDLQAVTSLESISSIGYAVDHLPVNAHLTVISRSDPALRLPQLRALGQLSELRANELAFTRAEAHELVVERAHIALSAPELDLLHARTEGWPAAIFLATLWLRSVTDPHEAVRVFGADHRFIADYLTAEVIASLDDDSRAFLLRVSVLGQFTPALCDVVLGRTDSEAQLVRLASANPFVARLERGRGYRVHSLFAEFAEYQLAALEPGAAAYIHRRASAWFRSHGECEQALEHAAAADDPELVADILHEHQGSLILSGKARVLLRWVGTLDDELIVQRPELAVASATGAMLLGNANLERRHLLELADRAAVAYPERVTAYVRATADMVYSASLEGDVGRAVEAGRRAVGTAATYEEAEVALVAALGAYARALYLSGTIHDAWTIATRAIEHPDIERRAPGHAYARTTLALVALDFGWLAAARNHAERAKAIIDGIGLNRTWLGANGTAALGCVLAAEGNLVEAERELTRAEQFFREDTGSLHHAWLLVLLAGVSLRRGRLAQAEATVRSALEAIDASPDSGRIASLAAVVCRDLERARSRAGWGEVLETPSEAEAAVLRLLVTDLSVRQIAGTLFISPNTVRSHTRHIYRKLGVNSREAAVARAQLLGLLA
jgi:ATP/maltotriose-dependent transcriptional regulator MalT